MLVLLILAAVVLSAGLFFALKKRARRIYPQFDWMGRPLGYPCSRGRHMIVGMTWEEVACMRCHLQVFAKHKPFPAGELMRAHVALAYWGSLYNKTQVSFDWEWPHLTRYTLLSYTELLVGLKVEVEDTRKGETDYLVEIGAGSIELDGQNIDPLTLEITRGQVAALILGQEKEVESAGGKLVVEEPHFFGFGWDVDDIRHLAFYRPDRKHIVSLPLSHELLGKVLRPWALAIQNGGTVTWPGLSAGNEPVFTVAERGRDHLHVDVWPQPSSGGLTLTQLRLREVDNGVVWQTTAQEVVVTTGSIRRVDMKDMYRRDKDATYRSLGDNDDPIPETTWLEKRECHFPIEQFVPICQTGWGQLNLVGDEGVNLKLYEANQKGYAFVYGTLSHPGIEKDRPVAWSCAAYDMMREWAQRIRAIAIY